MTSKTKNAVSPKTHSAISTLSPFRYPGGKSWLRREIIDWISSLHRRPLIFLEPFAGGGSISLAMAELNLADRVLMVEKDPEVAAVWRLILSGGGPDLINRIINFKVTRKAVCNILDSSPESQLDRAFQCILKNRMSRGGVMAGYAGILRKGENGKGLLSRWYPETISQRIEKISKLRDRLDFIEGDGIEIIHKHRHLKRAVYYIDPPYISEKTSPGGRLYRFSQVDPLAIIDQLDQVNGQFLITYQESEVIFLYARSKEMWVKKIPMRTSHNQKKNELVITKTKYW